MTRVVALIALLSCTAFAARPVREGPSESLAPVKANVPPSEPVWLFMVDVGTSLWSSSLVSVPAFSTTLGFGRRITRHVSLTAEVDGSIFGNPTGSNVLGLVFSATLHVAWDVLQLLRAAGSTLPIEAGPDIGAGVGLVTAGGFAVPHLQFGGFVRYIVSPSFSVGVRLRSQLPYWTSVPWLFSGGRYGLPAAFDPIAFSATASLIFTF